jgi:thioredoxin 2
VVAADDDSFWAAANTPQPVLVEFWAPWCRPCRPIQPAVEQAAREFAGRLTVVAVNIDAAPAIARRFDVKAIPTLLLLRGGREVARRTGVVPPSATARWLACSLQTPDRDADS